jgi:RNA polymerase primary sigma factor
MVLTAVSNDPDLGPAATVVEDAPRRFGLSRDEEFELAERIAGGDREARNRLVQANLRLVCKLACAFQGRGLSRDDLIGEGNLGLIRAAAEFDPRFGTRFSTYAAYWIKEAIRCALMNTAATIRLPSHVFRLMGKWRRAEWKLCGQRDRVPTFAEVATALGLSPTQESLVALALKADRVKLESSYSGESWGWLSDTAPDGHGPIEERLETDDEWAVALRRMGFLNARERAILVMLYGLEGEILAHKEIGSRLGLSREWVRKIEVRALRKLGHDHGQDAQGGRTGNRKDRAGRSEPSQARPSSQPCASCEPTRFRRHSSRPSRPGTAHPIGKVVGSTR